VITLDEIRAFKGVRADSGKEAKHKVVAAFKSVFLRGDPTEDQRLLVLAELSEKTEYFEICEDVDHGTLATHNAKRAMFAHIVSLAFMPGDEVAKLAKTET